MNVVLMSDERVLAVPVDECGEDLVDVRDVDGLTVDQVSRHADAAGAYAHLRTGVVRRLLLAQRSLPSGVVLTIVEGYRPPALQARYFEEYVAELRADRADLDAEQLHHLASRYVSPPAVAPHSSGAAVDVVLTDLGGEVLDMGSPLNASPEESEGRCYTAARGLSPDAVANRGLLVGAMTSAGLVNYPTEWWHWSYGDRYWAMSSGAPRACYGPVDLPA